MQALIFDLFNTLVRCESSLLPQATIAGREMPSTLGLVVDVLREHGHTVEIDQLARTTMQVSKEQEEEKLRSGREFPSSYRWSAVLAQLEIAEEADLVDTIVQRHMDALCGSAVITDEDRAALQQFGEQYPIALLSNFDHGPSARGLLDRLELTPLFQTIAVSDDLGWRKPEARVFLHVLEDLERDANECLYVGDSVSFDVVGAQNAGLQAAWITKPDKELPDGVEVPTYRAASIAELYTQLSA